jgi:hypothetical protein
VKIKKTVLVLFNSSRYALDPWVNDGRFNVVTVDYDSTDHSDAHPQYLGNPGLRRYNVDLSGPCGIVDVAERLHADGLEYPSLVISFPPCTDLAVSGARHWKAKETHDPAFQQKAVRMAKLASLWGCPYIIENPVSRLATLWRPADHYWHPADYAGYCPKGPHPEFPNIIPEQDRYNKKTGSWVGNGFVMPEPKALSVHLTDNPGWSKLGGKSARTKYIRSLTPRGFAQAIYEANCEVI